MAWVLLIVTLPIFFASLIYSTTFARSHNIATSFGANLVGATVGDLAEYFGMMFGYQRLVALIVVAYLGSLIALRRSLRWSN